MIKLNFPKYSLGYFPTPITFADRLSKTLGGPQILIKRDDMTGLATGGNKTRKLEYLFGDAVSQGCDSVITGGAMQSNHCRQTAAAAAKCNMECHLALAGQEPDSFNGNLLIDYILDAKIHYSGEKRKGENIPFIYNELVSSGKKPYVIPYGGSNKIGALGFVNAIKELKLQLEELNIDITHIIFATSSGGTQAGLTVGNKIFENKYRLIGIAIDKDQPGEQQFCDQVLSLSNEVNTFLGCNNNIDKNDIDIRSEYSTNGYGVVSDLEKQAIKQVAVNEGILLDPVYTGRAMAGLIDMIKKGEFSRNDTVLFWHTGGTAALFDYGEKLV